MTTWLDSLWTILFAQTDELRVTWRTDCLKKNDTDTLRWQADNFRHRHRCTQLHTTFAFQFMESVIKLLKLNVYKLSKQYVCVAPSHSVKTNHWITALTTYYFLVLRVKIHLIFKKIHHGDPFFYILIVPVSLSPMLQISPQHLIQLAAEKILLDIEQSRISKSRTDTLVAPPTHAVHN